jgi:hypothetical protein
MCAGIDGEPQRPSMQVTIDPAVLAELQKVVDLHRRYGADNPVDTVEGLVTLVLAASADGSRRPDSAERLLLEDISLVAYCSEHGQDRGCSVSPADREDGEPKVDAGSLLPTSPCPTEFTDAASVITETVELLSCAVAALHSVLQAFDTSEYRNEERWARKSTALREVYAVLRKPWPEDAASTAE